MKESVDKKLQQQIIKVFDNYEDGGAEHGWQELRKKYPRKPVRRVILWWSAAAAVLALTCTLLFLNPVSHDDNLVTKNKTITRAVNNDTTANKLPGLTENTTPLEKEANSSDRPARLSNQALALSSRKQAKTASVYSSDQLFAKEINDVDTAVTVSKKISSAEISALNEVVSPDITPQKPELTRPAGEKLQLHTDEPLTQNSSIESTVDIAGSNSFMADHDRKLLAGKKLRTTEKKQDSKFELSFYAGPFFNYAEGSSNAMNLGAGVSSGISLNKRFTLIAGLALANNTLTFNNEIPANSYAAFLSNTAMDQRAASSMVASPVPQISKLEAQLLNLDIPVNIRYSISREPGKVFITAGVSSFAYLNEAYHYSYNNLNSGSNAFSSSQSNDEEIDKSFGKFDLAQTLNLSFGLTHKAKLQSFVFEPFIKYPLGALGSQNIRFGSAGINFKLSINPSGNRFKYGRGH